MSRYHTYTPRKRGVRRLLTSSVHLCWNKTSLGTSSHLQTCEVVLTDSRDWLKREEMLHQNRVMWKAWRYPLSATQGLRQASAKKKKKKKVSFEREIPRVQNFKMASSRKKWTQTTEGSFTLLRFLDWVAHKSQRVRETESRNNIEATGNADHI